MTCDVFGGLLDALMDGELTDEQRREMMAHAQACPDCAAALRATVQLKALFDEMEPEVDVPLAAQARWRNAVRDEAARRRRGRLTRWAYAAAAAIVVLAGVGLALNMKRAPKRAGDMTLVAAKTAVVESATEEAAPEAIARDAAAFDAGANAVVETDGAADYAMEEAAAPEAFEADMAEEVADVAAAGVAVKLAPACEMTLRAKDVDTACSRISDLAREYEGAADVQRLEDGGANLYVTVDAADAGDFLNAVVPMDESGLEIKTPDVSGDGAVLILITLLPVE